MPSPDSEYMNHAISLAYRGAGYVSPNPMVGCVIVKNDQIIGQGYHEQFGGPHAEVNARYSCKRDLDGSTWYITLEPCAHFGKTPPCIDMILQHKPQRVVIGIKDPNPQTDGGSITQLKAQNIPVIVGVCEKECRELIKFFITNQQNKRPHVILKYTESQDGYITGIPGKQTKLSSEEMDLKCHKLRGEIDGILIGAGTMRADNPSLTTRYDQGRTAKRIILTTSDHLPLGAKVFTDEWKDQTIVIQTSAPPPPALFKERGSISAYYSTLHSNFDEATPPLHKEVRGDFPTLLTHLQTNHNIYSLLIEGGKQIWHWALQSPECIDEIWQITCPVILEKGVKHDIQMPTLFEMHTEEIYGKDVLKTYYNKS